MSARTIAEVITEAETLKTQVSALTAERDKFKADCETAKTELATTKTELATAKADADKAKADVATAKAEVVQIKADVEKAKLEAKTLDEKVAARIKELGIVPSAAAPQSTDKPVKKTLDEECIEWRKANNLPVPAAA